MSPALSVPEEYKMTEVGIIPGIGKRFRWGALPSFSVDLIYQVGFEKMVKFQ